MDQDPNQDPSNIGDAGDNTSNVAPEEPSQNQNIAQDNSYQPVEATVDSAVSPTPDSKSDKKTDQDTKSSRVPIIVLSILAVIILILGCLGIWFFGFYNNPDKVALDAVSNLLSAPNVSMNGGIVVFPLDDDAPSPRLILNLDTSSNHLPNSTTASLFVALDEDRTINLSLGTVQLADGVIYLQISKVMETIDNLNLSTSELAELEDVLAILETIDNEWWRISIPELVDSFELDQDLSSGIKEIYACVVDVTNADLTDELALLYRRMPFVNVVEVSEISAYAANNEVDIEVSTYRPATGYGLYEVSLNKDNLAHFINALPETSTAESFYDCYNSAIDKYPTMFMPEHLSATDFDELDASDITIDKDLHLYMEVSKFGHQIRSLHLYYEEDSFVASGGVSLKYDDVIVSPPNSYRPITDLIDEIIESIFGVLPDYEINTDPDDCVIDGTCYYNYGELI